MLSKNFGDKDGKLQDRDEKINMAYENQNTSKQVY